jgi:hypothetical protein
MHVALLNVRRYLRGLRYYDVPVKNQRVRPNFGQFKPFGRFCIINVTTPTNTPAMVLTRRDRVILAFLVTRRMTGKLDDALAIDW